MNAVKFTHAVYNTDVYIFPEQVFSIFTLPTNKATTLVGPASVAVPVTCTVEEAVQLINQAKKATNQGDK
jgi:hypothetical protein